VAVAAVIDPGAPAQLVGAFGVHMVGVCGQLVTTVAQYVGDAGMNV